MVNPTIKGRRHSALAKRFFELIENNKYGDRELRALIPHFFNELPAALLNLTSYDEAKRKLKTWLVNCMTQNIS